MKKKKEISRSRANCPPPIQTKTHVKAKRIKRPKVVPWDITQQPFQNRGPRIKTSGTRPAPHHRSQRVKMCALALMLVSEEATIATQTETRMRVIDPTTRWRKATTWTLVAHHHHSQQPEMSEAEPASEDTIIKIKTEIGTVLTIIDTETQKKHQEMLPETGKETTRSPPEKMAHYHMSRGVATHSSSTKSPIENKETPHQETNLKHVDQDRCVIMDLQSTKKQEQSGSSKTSLMSHIGRTGKFKEKTEDMKETWKRQESS